MMSCHNAEKIIDRNKNKTGSIYSEAHRMASSFWHFCLGLLTVQSYYFLASSCCRPERGRRAPGGQTLTHGGPARLNLVRTPPSGIHHWIKYHKGSNASAEHLILYWASLYDEILGPNVHISHNIVLKLWGNRILPLAYGLQDIVKWLIQYSYHVVGSFILKQSFEAVVQNPNSPLFRHPDEAQLSWLAHVDMAR